jgi:hypothetical protein
MPKRFTNMPERLREPHDVAWADLPVLFWKGMAITIVLGVITGLIWIGWRLIELHVLN